MNLLQFYWIQLTKNAFKFTGRTNRSDFWKFTYIQFFFIFLLTFLGRKEIVNPQLIEYISLVFFWGTLIQWLAITVRRLHDSNRNAWNLLILIVPIIGLIGMFVYTIDESDGVDNKYGPIPKSF